MGEPVASKADLGSHRSEMALRPAIRMLGMLGASVSSRQRQTSIELASVNGPETEGDALMGAVLVKQMGEYSECFPCLRVFQPNGYRQALIADFDVYMRANRDV